jgi:pectin methylesterase-like acyl-CoA thioesterase/pectate lyase
VPDRFAGLRPTSRHRQGRPSIARRLVTGPGRGRPVPRARQHLVGIVALLITGGAVFAAGIDSQAATTVQVDATYQLKVARSGMCLDVKDGVRTDGALVQQWGCTSGASWQRFRLVSASGGRYELVGEQSGKCLEVPNGQATNGLRLQLWACGNQQRNQLWTLNPSRGGTFQIVSASTGMCVTDQGASLASGAAIVQETCTQNTNKQWTFTGDGSASGPSPSPTAPPSPKPTTTGGSGSGTPKATVAADGSGTYRTVQAAIDAVPAGNKNPVTIAIKPGTYREKVTVPATKPFVTLQGTGSAPGDVVIVRNVSAGQAGNHLGSATVDVEGHDFTATNLSIVNDFDESTATNGQQALALYLDSDRSVLRNVRLLADQDTFLLNNNARSYVVDTYIEGTVDFIYGGGTAVFDRCTIYEKRTVGGPITAASTDTGKTYGFLFYKSTIRGAKAGTVQLGRPWRQGAQVLYRESSLSDIATAQPWINMGDATWQKARYLEYKNTGPGATVNGNRAQLSDARAPDYTPQKYLAGSDGWNPVTGGSSSGGSSSGGSSSGGSGTSGRAWSNTPDGFASTAGGTTGGAAGPTATVTTYADLVRYATATEPYVVRIAAAITVPQYGYEIPVKSNKTLIGVGTKGAIVHGGIFLATGTHNVIIRNLSIGETLMADDDPGDKVYDYDGIQMDTADHIWIDHNRIMRANDGLIDSRKDTSYLTISWNEIGNGRKAFGIGWTTNVTARMTIHHNWIHDTVQRNPSVDNVALAHLYDNYLQNISSYGNLSRGASKTVIENSYYDHVNNPYDWNMTATLTQRGSIVVNCTGNTRTNGTTFTPSSYYPYTLDPAKDVPALLKAYAGPQANLGS